MDLEMVLNELSLYPQAVDAYDARRRMAVLLEIIILATRHGVKKILRTHSNFVSEELAPGYPVARWLNDPNVDRDLQRYLKAIITKSPFLADVKEKSVLEIFDLSDYFWEEQRVVGLGVVFLLDALAISLCSDKCWFQTHLRLRISQLGDDGEITDVFEDVHLCPSGLF